MFRPPITDARLSAVNDLLCMRRLSRSKSVRNPSTPLARRERVVEPDLDVGMRVQRRQDVVQRRRCRCHRAASARARHARRPCATHRTAACRQVAVPDVVLHVEGAICSRSEEHAHGERVPARWERQHARAARVLGGDGSESPCRVSCRRCLESPTTMADRRAGAAGRSPGAGSLPARTGRLVPDSRQPAWRNASRRCSPPY